MSEAAAVAPATTAPQSAPPTAATSAPTGETPVPQASETTQAPAGETPAKPEDAEKSDRARHRRQLNTAYRKAAEAQARAELFEKQLNEAKASHAPAVDPSAPKLEQFNDIEAYAAAKADYEKNKALKEADAKRAGETQKQYETRLTHEWENRAEAAADKYDDFADVVGDIKPTTPALAAIMHADNGPDIAYHLVKNQKEANRIGALPVFAQLLEIGKLSAKLAAEPVKVKTPSKAPAPITPLTGGAPVTSELPSATDSIDAWMKKRNKQVAAKRK